MGIIHITWIDSDPSVSKVTDINYNQFVYLDKMYSFLFLYESIIWYVQADIASFRYCTQGYLKFDVMIWFGFCLITRNST